ncbi:hypothetical protein C7974DRAFT_302582 [Boeremia exigua]|uniref:uncharacterized protein n=1 Tax=Boeremia exigua TaxID=749465 RepID=UPI001E8DF1A7|nr:uncharacterized protein C7974DRAFT_302582 [Boeremia exigua]KAH6643178.1 hypothetical protein C7974DRAFT_302582 [Boeremia exigua]
MPWTPTTALPSALALALSILTFLALLASPPRHRALALTAPLLLLLYAFKHHMAITPWHAVNDTLARMMYIWGSYGGYVFLTVRVKPVVRVQAASGWRERWGFAGKVLYARRLRRCTRDTPHNLTRTQFLAHHASRALLFTATNHAWDTYIDPALRTHSPPGALAHRTAMVWDTCVGDMLYFSSIYSLFAVLWVCVLRLDAPHEWSLALFGSLADCWSVRRYWGVYWHDFIRESFAAHVQLLTRGVLGLRRGAVRRVVENGLVFAASGGAHAAVRWVQTGGQGEVWTVAVWFAAQIGPIVVEGVVGSVWGQSRARARVRDRLGGEVLGRLERMVGYGWVLAWMFWSVPKHLLTRQAWETERWEKRYEEVFSKVEETMKAL